MPEKVLTESEIIEIVKLKANQVSVDEISTRFGISIPQTTQILIKNKELISVLTKNKNMLFNISELSVEFVSSDDKSKKGNIQGVERHIDFLFPELGVMGVLNKYYIEQKLSPDEICKVLGFGSQKGWINLVQKYRVARSRKEAQKAKWTTDRGKRHLEKIKPLMEIITGKGKRKNISPKLRWKVLEKYEFTCQKCGRMPPEVVIEVEHINPIREKGKDDPSNLTVLCDECNIGKYHNEKDKKLARYKKIQDAREIYKERFRETYNVDVESIK